jgi:hypothetical protein
LEDHQSSRKSGDSTTPRDSLAIRSVAALTLIYCTVSPGEIECRHSVSAGSQINFKAHQDRNSLILNRISN